MEYKIISLHGASFFWEYSCWSVQLAIPLEPMPTLRMCGLVIHCGRSPAQSFLVLGSVGPVTIFFCLTDFWLNNVWSYTSSHLYIFMVCCSIKQRDNFTFSFPSSLYDLRETRVCNNVLCNVLQTFPEHSEWYIIISRQYYISFYMDWIHVHQTRS